MTNNAPSIFELRMMVRHTDRGGMNKMNMCWVGNRACKLKSVGGPLNPMQIHKVPHQFQFYMLIFCMLIGSQAIDQAAIFIGRLPRRLRAHTKIGAVNME